MPGAPKLSDRDIDLAVVLLNGWSSKLTWDLFLRAFALELDHGHVYSKVAMLKQDRIASAWKLAKQRLSDEAKEAGTRGHGTSAVATLRKMLDQAKAELAAERSKNHELLRTFKRWQFNAERHGLRLTQLDAPVSRPGRQA